MRWFRHAFYVLKSVLTIRSHSIKDYESYITSDISFSTSLLLDITSSTPPANTTTLSLIPPRRQNASTQSPKHPHSRTFPVHVGILHGKELSQWNFYINI